ncbi:hypothetical protein T484DRAFT_1789983 [Baffinella frigidus]|nr:hypothetical protein T484DRAFT_1789983 [Cryptophyta sp. CCMP2293]
MAWQVDVQARLVEEQARLVDDFHTADDGGFEEQWVEGQETAQLLTKHWLPMLDSVVQDAQIALHGHEGTISRIAACLSAILATSLLKASVEGATKAVTSSLKLLRGRVGNTTGQNTIRQPSMGRQGKMSMVRKGLRLKRNLRPDEEEVEADMAGVPESQRGFLWNLQTQHGLPRNLQTVARSLHDVIDPLHQEEAHAGNELEGENKPDEDVESSDDESEDCELEDEEDSARLVRTELDLLCRDFHSTSMVDGKIRIGALDLHSGRTFKADGALLVVDLLAGTPLEDKHAWEKLVVQGCSLLRVLCHQWHGAATEVFAPEWLLRGIPTLVVKLALLQLQESFLSILKANNAKALLQLQESFLSILKANNAKLAEPLFTHLRERIRMFEGFVQTESLR